MACQTAQAFDGNVGKSVREACDIFGREQIAHGTFDGLTVDITKLRDRRTQ